MARHDRDVVARVGGHAVDQEPSVDRDTDPAAHGIQHGSGRLGVTADGADVSLEDGERDLHGLIPPVARSDVPSRALWPPQTRARHMPCAFPASGPGFAGLRSAWPRAAGGPAAFLPTEGRIFSDVHGLDPLGF